MKYKSFVDCLQTLIMTRSNEVSVKGFQMAEFDFLINSMVYQEYCMFSIKYNIIINQALQYFCAIEKSTVFMGTLHALLW